MIIGIVTSPIIKSYNKMRKDRHGLAHNMMDQFSPEMPWIFPTLPETEFPGLIFPPNMHMCGPIILPSLPIDECDPNTSEWLNKPGMRTVLVNLGSLVISDPDRVRQLAGGLRMLLSKFKDVQVLWKVIADGEIQVALNETVDADRMKVVDWFEAEPSAIVCHPNVICSVHHGGANSFFEAVS
jgi:hypothetical protein